MEPPFVNLTEAVRRTTIKRTALLRMINDGEFKGIAFKLGTFRDWRFDRARLEQWIEQQRGSN